MIILNKILAIIPILFYPFVNILILVILGFGLAYFIIPKYLRPFIFWLSPWVTIIISIFYFVTLSQVGISINQAIIPFIIVCLGLNVYLLIKVKPKLNLNVKENLMILVLVGSTLILNLSPLIKRDKMLTTISMGNNDIIVYVAAGDYLKDHTIAETFKIEPEPNVGTLLQNGYRWGPPIINGLFLTLLNLEGFQYTYASEAVLFSLFIPLVYILFKELFGRSSTVGLITSGIFTGFNANLLYILYHDFFGQVLFWGISLLILIFFYSYFLSQKVKKAHEPKKNNYFKTFLVHLNRYDLILGILITVLYMSYHEGAVFLFAPLLIFLAAVFFLKRNLFNDYFQALLRIAFISLITGFNLIVHGIIDDYKDKVMADPNQPIGWQLFRNNLPFPNPFEAMGFWSIHNFDPMPTVLAIILSLIVILIVIKGLSVSRSKILTISCLLIFLAFFYLTGIALHNFFGYYRALTYALPFIIVIFSIGLTRLFEEQKYLWFFIIVILIGLEFLSALKLNKRFIGERLAVERSYISILGLKSEKIEEPVYLESHIENEIPLWMQIWTDYFLYSKGVSTKPTNFQVGQFENKIPGNSLVLISKPTPWYRPPQVLLTDVVWENEYYKLGRICNDDKCLTQSKDKLNEISIGQNTYEDSLLISGWGTTEDKTRWANEKESTLRLVTGDNNAKSLTVEALSLKKPQALTVYVDDKLIVNQAIDTQWKRYSFPIDYALEPGVHKIKFTYANGYRPVDVIPGNLDGRTLYVDFKEIKLE